MKNNATIINRTYYVYNTPTFARIIELGKHIEDTFERMSFADDEEHLFHVDIVSATTGEVFATRDEFGLWDFSSVLPTVGSESKN